MSYFGSGVNNNLAEMIAFANNIFFMFSGKFLYYIDKQTFSFGIQEANPHLEKVKIRFDILGHRLLVNRHYLVLLPFSFFHSLCLF